MGCPRSDAGVFFFIINHFCTENPKNKKNFDVFLCLCLYKNIYLECIFNKSIKIIL